jgi:hypothetical protein
VGHRLELVDALDPAGFVEHAIQTILCKENSARPIRGSI